MDIQLEVVIAELQPRQGENHRLHHAISASSDQIMATMLLEIQQPVRNNSVNSRKGGEWRPEISGLQGADATVTAFCITQETLQLRPLAFTGLPRVEGGGALTKNVVYCSINPVSIDGVLSH